MVPPRIQKLILADYRVGVLVMPGGDRASLGAEALSGLDQIARANKLTEDKRLVAFLDQGIFGSPGNAAALSAALGLDQYCDVKSEQDSRSVKGLQLADLVAHTGGVMLLETLGLLKSR